MSNTQLQKCITATLLLTLYSILSFAQVDISGKVTDKRGEAIPGANVYIQGTYDGATTDLEGNFAFTTTRDHQQTLVISFIGYHKIEQVIDLNANNSSLHFKMTEEINKLDGVVITAGAFEASDEKKSVVLKPLDIATTAGATADIPGALNTLPGTQNNGESGRLFVRGGYQ